MGTAFSKLQWYVVLGASLYVWSLLGWDYAHGGVPVHHVLAREDMPGLSNWWGGLLIPLLALFLTYRIRQRIGNPPDSKLPATIVYTFLGALLYAAGLCVAFALGNKDVPFYMLIGLVVLSLFFPVYRSEIFLGLVVGMIYTFGGVLPIFIVSVISIIGVVLYNVVRPMLLLAVKQIRKI